MNAECFASKCLYTRLLLLCHHPHLCHGLVL
jgi:hypothetical protein